MPGSIPPTSQLDWLISTTAMIVLLWSRVTRDLLKSFGWGIAALHRLMQRRSCHVPAARPIASIGPAPAKALLGVANRRRRHERQSHLQVQVRDGDAYLERLPVGFPFAVGPRVRIRLPPGKSPLRTCCCRAFEPAGSHM